MKQLSFTPEEIAEKKKQKKINDLAIIETEWERLTPKQQSVIMIMARKPGTTFIQAVRDAGYVIGNKARVSAIRKSIEGKLGKSLKEIFGVTEYDLLAVFVDAMKADKTVLVTEKEYDTDDKLKKETQKMVNLGPDHGIRTKTAMFIAKLGNYEPVSKIKVDHKHEHKLIKNETIQTLKDRVRTQESLLDPDFEVINEPTVN